MKERRRPGSAEPGVGQYGGDDSQSRKKKHLPSLRPNIISNKAYQQFNRYRKFKKLSLYQ